jgi:two-component system OmpR family sensor kinase
VVLELLFSTIFYAYINYSVNNELQEAMIKQAKYLFSNYNDVAKALEDKKGILEKTMKLKARIVSLPDQNYRSIHFQQFKKNNKYFIKAYFPYEFALQRYLILTADITKQKRTENQVTRGIIFITVFGLAGILIYAFFLSNMLIAPIKVFTQKIAKMNENALSPIELKNIPDEFLPLEQSVNSLVKRIKSFINYKKELFVGTAHELKTPLAVIKTKSQVSLMKRNKTEEDLVEALKQNIRSVDDMDKIISSILEFGRAEGAQFEKPELIDAVEFLGKMCDEFAILAQTEGKTLRCHLSPRKIMIRLPELLLRQIVQNLLQNAIRFTPVGKKISFFSYVKDQHLYIKIRDEGKGIDEDQDLFAPFKRSNDSTGAGLGLFLVKSAADALQADISIKNRTDRKGTVATLVLSL